MNLFEYFSNFCELIKQVEIDTKTQAMYFNLLYLFNQNYFPKSLKISNDYLKQVLHITYKMLIVSRTTLVNLQLITYVKGNGNKSGEYSLLKICMPYGNDKTSRVCPERTTKSSFVCPERTTNDTQRTRHIINNKYISQREKEPIKHIDNNIYTHAHTSDSSLSPKQLKFKESFPQRKIDCEVSEQIDIDLLIQKIKESEFLNQVDNMSLKSCISRYDQIINNYYKTYHKTNNDNFKQRTYTKEECNSLFDDLNKIDWKGDNQKWITSICAGLAKTVQAFLNVPM